MAYTAIEKMRQENLKKFGTDYGPFQPDTSGTDKNDLKGAALRFLHNRCEGLRFSEEISQTERRTGILQGTSINTGQIPYDMQMDINRLCMARELEKFIESGNAQDAYNVYYCYFELTLTRYGRSKKMIELLSEFESNGSSLLMKHRDHYSHTVYVFTLGLAIYETNEHFRRAYKQFYHFDTDEKNIEADRSAAHHFLTIWGMTALFHDIGYPFEIPFEQVMSYFEVAGTMRGEGVPYLAYHNMVPMTKLNAEEKEHFRKLYHKTFDTTDELFAHVTARILSEEYSFSEGHLSVLLSKKASEPNSFNYFIDHAYFSANRLYREIVNSPLGPSYIKEPHMDALCAILLHNSIYKFAIAFYKDKNPEIRKAPLRMETFPLAYLLFLCDELQCWDRTAYGRSSRLELHPFSADMDFSGNALQITYNFDSEETEKINAFRKLYNKWEADGENGNPPRLKEWSDMDAKEKRFQKDIESIVDTSTIPLTIKAAIKEIDRGKKKIFLSTSNFLHLYDFAVALNGRYSHHGEEENLSTETLEQEFGTLSLEYQLSNINQAKIFAEYLNKIDCFYTDRPVDFEMVTSFTEEQVNIIAPMEHERWTHEKQSMGWTHGSFYETAPADMLSPVYRSEKEARKALREQLRMNELIPEGNPTSEEIRNHYMRLLESEQEKDFLPFNSMLKLIRKFEGLRIYRLSK